MHDALVHIRQTGTFPVSRSPPSTTNTTTSPSGLTHRANHGCCSLPSPPPSPSLPKTQPPTKTTPTTRSLTTATPPSQKQPTLDSKEDLNTVGTLPLTPSQLATTTAKLAAWLQPGNPGSLIFSPEPPKQKIKLCLLDGFLLYAPAPHPLSSVLPLLDIKLLLQADRRRAVERRAARDGYVTLEGFWKDPPGYVEDVVWPNYVAAHRWLFEGGEVDRGRVDEGVLRREGIFAAPFDGDREDGGFGEVLEWAVGVVMGELERICLGEGLDGKEN